MKDLSHLIAPLQPQKDKCKRMMLRIPDIFLNNSYDTKDKVPSQDAKNYIYSTKTKNKKITRIELLIFQEIMFLNSM